MESRLLVVDMQRDAAEDEEADVVALADMSSFGHVIRITRPIESIFTTGSTRMVVSLVDSAGEWVCRRWVLDRIGLDSVPRAKFQDMPANMCAARSSVRGSIMMFVRVGLVKNDFQPLIEALQVRFPSITNGVTVGKHHYWLNAIWNLNEGTTVFTKMNRNRVETLNDPHEVIMIMNGMSATCEGMIRISTEEETVEELNMTNLRHQLDVELIALNFSIRTDMSMYMDVLES
jgi:hypothetical protein